MHHLDQFMTREKIVQTSEPFSGTEGEREQTLDARDEPNQGRIDRSIVFVVADKVTRDESRRKIAGEWMTSCNELF